MKKFNGKKLRLLREEAGWTIGKFAEELQKSHKKAGKSHVWRWETKGVVPRTDYLMSICSILKCEPMALMK